MWEKEAIKSFVIHKFENNLTVRAEINKDESYWYGTADAGFIALNPAILSQLPDVEPVHVFKNYYPQTGEQFFMAGYAGGGYKEAYFEQSVNFEGFLYVSSKTRTYLPTFVAQEHPLIMFASQEGLINGGVSGSPIIMKREGELYIVGNAVSFLEEVRSIFSDEVIYNKRMVWSPYADYTP